MKNLDLRQANSFLRYEVLNKKFNPNNIGYISRVGLINFSTKESANKYAKNRVLSALKNNKPFERAIFINKNRILKEINGNIDEVKFSDIRGIPKDTSVVHGHPSATPISLPDYFILKTNPALASIHAYNQQGEVSSLYKVDNTKDNNIITNIMKRFCWDDPKYVEARYNQTVFDTKDLIKTFTLSILSNIMISAKYKINKIIRDGQTSNQGRQRIHEFWDKHAHNLGVKYYTNYSKLDMNSSSFSEKLNNFVSKFNKILFDKQE